MLRFATGRDPIEAVEQAAQELVLDAVERGWTGPPFDPFELARMQNIPVEAREELRDARTVPIGRGAVAIEYNPTRPAGRLRFSLAHEIAHTLFPDVADAARYRANPEAGPPDAWQLELLCNIAAGELLMPTDAVPEFRTGQLEIERLMEIRKEFEVSTEALLRRVVKLTSAPVAMFAASRTRPDDARSRFHIDYAASSRAWNAPLAPGQRVPVGTVLAECTAVGFTAKQTETWSAALDDIRVEAIGAPPYPGHRYPRVLGLLHARGARAVPEGPLVMVHGDATRPHGSGPRIIVHLVNDRTATWGGGGFAAALRRRHPQAQDDYAAWIAKDRARLTLGTARIAPLMADLHVATIVAQRGYGPSARARIRYDALRAGLEQVAAYALDHAAAVHMPRLGTGMAGGRWPIIQELIERSLTRRRVPVTVYVPPGEPIDLLDRGHVQLGLGL